MRPKPGSRAIGIAASDGTDYSQLCGAVVRADRVAEEFVFARCTVGGSDATAAAQRLLNQLERPDCQWCLVGGIAPAWYNLLDLVAIHETVARPVIGVSFEASDGLAAPIREEFSGVEQEKRLAIYEKLPPRHHRTIANTELWIRPVGIDPADAERVVEAFLPAETTRPEPIRVAQAAARAGRQQAEQFGWATETTDS